jgi:addiction module HigA family antidote
VPPGDILLEALDERGMSQSELARRTDRPTKTINEIVKGKAAITPETAIQLERVLGISARFWTGLEATFRDHLARSQLREDLKASAGWVHGFPIKDMVKRELIAKHTKDADIVDALLSYFRVSSPAAWDRHWMNPSAAYRASKAFMASPKAVAAWLRWGELEAAKLNDLPPFDSRRFREVLHEIRPLTRRGPFMQIFKQVQALCREAGVIILLTPELQGTHLSGAARWIGERPVMQLSGRHKVDDQFWHTFFHEAGHVLQPSRRRDVIETIDYGKAPSTEREEVDADRFARDISLPPDAYAAFVAADNITEETVRAFAKEQDIAPGIVVGRLQADGLVDRSHMFDLKKPIRLPF